MEKVYLLLFYQRERFNPILGSTPGTLKSFVL